MLSSILSTRNAQHLQGVLLIAEFFLCAVIILKVSYTEIDWKAYMQEVAGFQSGERDYTKIYGDTGPLVYPAGFLYVFTVLKRWTRDGTDILAAQRIFGVIYMITISLVMALYSLDGAVPAVASVLLVLSKRIHSIYLLRMFNDCIAVLLGYVAFLLFTQKEWRTGSMVYSLAVSVKMNMLLYAPGVLLVLLMGTDDAWETFNNLFICALVQVLLGAPFLTTYPVQYITKAFELNRVFTYKWTVNFKFLSEEVFVGKELSLLLLGLTLLCFGIFAYKWITEVQKQLKDAPNKSLIGLGGLSVRFVLVTLFTSNFIGIAFARTLHYQFYCWYFHTLPYLLWHCSDAVLPTWAKLAVFAGIELCFNVYPATWWSSALLQTCHVALLVGLYLTPVPLARQADYTATRDVKAGQSQTKAHLRKVD